MRLTSAELTSYEENGYLVRDGAFSAEEVKEIHRACEETCTSVAARSVERAKVKVSQYYVFERDVADSTLIKWEPGDGNVIQGLEPVAHLHPYFGALAKHPAFTEPTCSILGVDEVALFTEKLNTKRARVGGEYALHKDYPYWTDSAEDPERLVTLSVALDDSTAENGALEVLPGSHKMKNPPTKDSELDFERNELDPDRLDTSGMIVVEVPAGSVIMFGPHLIHRSGPNKSDVDRRALLYTFQPAGLRHSIENMRRWFESQDA